MLGAERVSPEHDATVVRVAQIARVLTRLAAAGTLAGRPATVCAFDSGYDLTRIAYLAGRQGLDARSLPDASGSSPAGPAPAGTSRTSTRSARGPGTRAPRPVPATARVGPAVRS